MNFKMAGWLILLLLDTTRQALLPLLDFMVYQSTVTIMYEGHLSLVTILHRPVTNRKIKSHEICDYFFFLGQTITQ